MVSAPPLRQARYWALVGLPWIIAVVVFVLVGAVAELITRWRRRHLRSISPTDPSKSTKDPRR